ncbi:dihydrofolate reductase [Apilactobacillus ozensis]|uniref:Dihydrofolate reductase n=1 Tax=Apilactobacillus ozensis DSM 23829 = JCM 17196 TaxID=1423781 RepID=A0A0R2AKZ0_9LACO|nr:dihydrofolate reductase [Apilactobacillus ozensis]KRM67880.1 dihydrofolate reductase region [Apilactobacillus ozensis DSM 23829 = JCM 17196]MCK8606494.1 dihydrofolate reductase [Apilactobacillus ozensis]
MISFLWAEGSNHIIGKNGNLPWHLPADMRYFKKLTTGNTIVTGRKTYLSFGKPLPNRKNMVITTSNNINDAGVLVFHSINEFIEYSKKHVDEEIFVVGGANIFEQLVPYADRLYKTEIEHDFDGDTYMPTINYDNFKLINTIPGKVDDKNIYDFNFKVFQKIK